MGCLGYTTWRRFKDAINRAMESCKSAEIEVSDHFANTVKMVEIGSNAVRDVDDIYARKGLKVGQKILDYMGSTELIANLFRISQTEETEGTVKTGALLVKE